MKIMKKKHYVFIFFRITGSDCALNRDPSLFMSFDDVPLKYFEPANQADQNQNGKFCTKKIPNFLLFIYFWLNFSENLIVFRLFQFHFMLLFSRQGKIRLQKWYTATSQKDKRKITRDLVTLVLSRKPKMCSFLEYRDIKIVYKR